MAWPSEHFVNFVSDHPVPYLNPTEIALEKSQWGKSLPSSWLHVPMTTKYQTLLFGPRTNRGRFVWEVTVSVLSQQGVIMKGINTVLARHEFQLTWNTT